MKTPFHIFALFLLFLTLSACATTQGKIADGKYYSARGWFSVPIPRASNWAQAPFAVEDISVNQPVVGDFDLVAFWVKDFGEVLIASVRHIPEDVLVKMKQDDDRTVLSNLAYKSLYDWRDNLPKSLPVKPKVVEDTYLNTSHGEAILRVYMAEKGSLLAKATGRRPTAADTFDTLIAVILVKQKNHYICAIAENDAKNDSETLKVRVKSFFESMLVHRASAQ
jgi:hypothetical protein